MRPALRELVCPALVLVLVIVMTLLAAIERPRTGELRELDQLNEDAARERRGEPLRD